MWLLLWATSAWACEVETYDVRSGAVVLDGQSFRGQAAALELERRDCHAAAALANEWRRQRGLTTGWAVAGCFVWPLWLPLLASVPRAHDARFALLVELGKH